MDRADKAEALRLFEEHLIALGRADSTRRLYLTTARRFLAGSMPLHRITPDDVRRFLAHRRAEGVEVWEREASHLRVFFRFLVETGHLPTSPAEEIRASRRPVVTRAALSPESIAALLVEAADDQDRTGPVPRAMALRDRAAIEILFAVGVRASEACAVLVTDLDPTSGALRLRPVKRGQPRTLPAPRAALVEVRLYLAEGRPLLVEPDGRDLGRLLVSKNGRPIQRDTLRRLVVRAARGAGFHAYPHAVRRGLATALVRAGVTLPVIQFLLGHRSLAATQHYLGTDIEDMRRALAVLDRTE